MKTSTVRAFLALLLSSRQMQDLSSLSDCLKQYPQYHHLKWSKPHNYHLTMRFLGNVTMATLDQLDRQLPDHLSQIAPLTLDFDRLQLIPSASKPKVLALTANATPEIESCLKQIDQALHAVNLHLKKNRFIPHITLARFPTGSRFEGQPANPENIRSFQFHQLHLIQSKLTPSGPIYSPHSEYLFRY